MSGKRTVKYPMRSYHGDICDVGCILFFSEVKLLHLCNVVLAKQGVSLAERRRNRFKRVDIQVFSAKAEQIPQR